MRRIRRGESARERGFVLVLVALMLLGLILIIGFAVDVGAWYLNASRLQRAADSAALAGAASLPDTVAATDAANGAYSRNGFTDGVNSITITNTATPMSFVSTVKNSKVPTYFTHIIFSNLTMSRSSNATPPGAEPKLGTPFNVLGTGDLDIPGIPGRQNFWLASNGICSAKEDGDYFGARWDGNKGPFNSTLNGHDYTFGSGANHSCPNTVANPRGEINNEYSPTGYSYYVDVPPPKVAGGTVTIKIYDATFRNTSYNDFHSNYPADNAPWMDTAYYVYKTSGTPDDPTNDVRVAARIVNRNDTRLGADQNWMDLYTAPYGEIQAGAQYRVQIVMVNFLDNETNHFHGGNSYAIGAIRSSGTMGCDSRSPTEKDCPRVSGLHAESVFTNLNGSPGSTIDFYFAEVDTSYIGRTFNAYLWDPGEGVQQIQLVGPDGTPLPFDWDAYPSTGDTGTGVTSIQTDVSGPQPGAAGTRTNDYKFNDRLVTLHVTLPPSYANMVTAAGGDKWLRIRYTIGTQTHDRTTWGASVGGGNSGPPHLTRP